MVFDGYNDMSHHDYSWNSLQTHSANTVAGTVRGGFKFNEAFYYDRGSHHYYLTERARNYLDDRKETYFKKGSYSVVYPTKEYNYVSNSRNIHSSTNSGYSSTNSGYCYGSTNNSYGSASSTMFSSG
jgi:hypothetical protein